MEVEHLACRHWMCVIVVSLVCHPEWRPAQLHDFWGFLRRVVPFCQTFSAVTHSAVAASAVLVPPPVSLHVYFAQWEEKVDEGDQDDTETERQDCAG